MKNRGLSISTKKALNEIIGEPAGREIADLIHKMETEIESFDGAAAASVILLRLARLTQFLRALIKSPNNLAELMRCDRTV